MRIFDTKYFIDKHRELVQAYYGSLITDDLRDPSSLRALLETKMYHLPPYFLTDLKTKIALNNLFRKTEGNTVLEYDLLHPNASLQGQSRRDQCPQCGRHKQLITMHKTLCVDCWSNLIHKLYSLWKANIVWCDAPLIYFNCRQKFHESAPVPGYEWFWEIEHWKDLCEMDTITEVKEEFKFLLRSHKHKQDTYLSHSPKHTLLATLIGCRECGVKHKPDTIWTDPADNWLDGLCPKCKPKRGIWHNSIYEPIGYDACCVCGNMHLPYAMWGMCVECYQHWQDKYLDVEVLFEAAKQLGTTALLLIRPEVQWVGYIKDNLPVSYSRKRGTTGDLVEWKPKLPNLLNIDVRAEVQRHVNTPKTEV